MRFSVQNTPAATIGRALVVLAVAAASAAAGWSQGKQYRPQPDYVQIGTPDQAEGRRILADFRQRGIAGDYYLEFELRVMPRRGAERVSTGRLWGSRNDDGAITRVVLLESGGERRLLLQNGAKPALWSWQSGAAVPQKLGLAEDFAPLAQTDLTPFDLQMPFLYWPDFAYEGTAKVRGRPADRFLLYPPAEVATAAPMLKGVRISLDSQFHALVGLELIGDGGKVLRSISLLELKKVREQWIPQTIDVRDDATRNKTRFTVTAAALGTSFAGALFAPATLAEDVRPPAPDQVVRFAP